MLIFLLFVLWWAEMLEFGQVFFFYKTRSFSRQEKNMLYFIHSSLSSPFDKGLEFLSRRSLQWIRVRQDYLPFILSV